MSNPYTRKVTPLERLFIVLAELDTPFSNQMVLEGTGTLDESRWEKAVHEACEANPGSRVVYRGRSRWAKWVDTGVAVPVRSFDGSRWNAQGPEGAPFFFEPLPFKDTHSCEVVLVQGDPARVVFRSLHAVMDGRGTLFWAQDIFRALRGEPLIGTTSTMTDVEIMSRLNYPVNLPRKPKDCLAPTGAIDGDEPGKERVYEAGSRSFFRRSRYWWPGNQENWGPEAHVSTSPSICGPGCRVSTPPRT